MSKTWNAWTRLCEANVNHYNNHPNTHTAIAGAGLLGAAVLIHVMARKAGESMIPKDLRHK